MASLPTAPAPRIYQIRGAGAVGAAREECFQNADKRFDEADEALAQYSKCVSDEKEKTLFTNLKSAWGEYKDAWNAHKEEIMQADSIENGVKLMEKRTSKIYAPKVTPALDALSDYNSKNADETVKRSQHTAATAVQVVILAIISATLAAAVLGLVITRVITRPLNLIGARMREVTEGSITDLEQAVVALRDGDLTVPVKVESNALQIHQKDELGANGRRVRNDG